MAGEAAAIDSPKCRLARIKAKLSYAKQPCEECGRHFHPGWVCPHADEDNGWLWSRKHNTWIAPMRTEHRVKSWPDLFQAILSGRKRHDLRRSNDRAYNVGDILVLCEYIPASQIYTGRQHRVEITYVTSADFPCALSNNGLSAGYCILSIAPENAVQDIRAASAQPTRGEPEGRGGGAPGGAGEGVGDGES